MSRKHTGASITDNEEHVSLNGINVKGVAPYSFDGAEIVPVVSDIQDAQIDSTTTPGVVYVGAATPGSSTSSSVWQIQSINTSSGVSVTWANGNGNYTNAWTNRASLSYS